MNWDHKKLRVLYSFPHKLGADRICYTAWQQVNGLAAAGAELLVFPGALERPVPAGVKVQPTLARGKLRIPYKLLGTMRALALHDHIVSRRLEKLAGQIDIVHVWPSAALKTIRVAKRLGIPTVLERPNAHTRYAYDSVQAESKRLGIVLPPDDEYAFKEDVLAKEEDEFREADYLLCPSDFVKRTFLDRGFAREKLLRHQYGYDEKRFFAKERPKDAKRGITMLFVGVAAVRKGTHFALEAWLKSPASQEGIFQIAGTFLPAYEKKLVSQLSHPSVRLLGYRKDVPELMGESDVLVLPSLEEGFPLVCMEAIGCGCVPLVSEVAGGVCNHMKNSLIHRIGDVHTLSQQITTLHQDRDLLERLREGCLQSAPGLTWRAAGSKLLEVYQQAIALSQSGATHTEAASASSRIV